MSRIHVMPPARRMAIFLVAIAFVATISPGLALAANGPPQPVDDPVTTAEDSPTSGNVLTNDGNNGDGPLEVTGFGPLAPSIGTLNVETDGDFTFTPAADWNGSTSTTYTVYNGKHSRPGNILITVTPVQDAPDADDDTVTIDEDAATAVTAAILANDSDVDGDTLSVSDVSNATGGGVDLSAGVVTFTPDANLCGDGEGSFDYDISDGNGGSDSASVTVDITCANDAPAAGNDTVDVTEDTATDVTAQILANDTDVEGDTLAVSDVSNATGGTVDLTAGVVTFTPTANLCGDGEGGFDYDVSDGNDTGSGTVSVDITCVNDAPVAVDDTGNVAGGSGATDFDVLANDTDIDTAHGSLTVFSASVSASAGSASVVGGKVRFTPLGSFSGDAVITYAVSDGALQDTGTLTVTVGTDATPPVVTAPTVHFDNGRVNETAPLLISWSAIDAGSGIASYEVQVSAGGKAFTTIYTGAGTSVRRQFPFKTSLVFRVRATDGANNVSPWATADSRRIVAYQRSSTSLSFSGKWTVVASTSSSGTDYLHTTTLGNRAALTFTGREVLYVAPMTSASGHAKVTVGGTLIGRFNLRSASTRYGRIIAKAVWGTNGAHTIRVTNDQAGRRTNLDAFVVLK